MREPDPILCTAFLLLVFFCAGLAQVAWLKSELSKRFAWPVDGGLKLRGRRLFGANKTLRGFMVMVPAVALIFILLHSIFSAIWPEGLWDLSAVQLFGLGAWAGLVFMLAELPNSFLKRQCDIAPGCAPPPGPLRIACFLIDQVDSVLGALLALAMFVPLPLPVWIASILLGMLLHWLFNVLLKCLGMKARAA